MKHVSGNGVSCAEIDGVIARHKAKPGFLLGVLEEVQQLHRHKYLPRETLEYIAARTDTPLARVYGVVSFYAFFNLKPQGDHTVVVCRGTACHTRGSKKLLDDLKSILGLKEEGRQGEKVFLTTPDNKFTLKTVACFGQCALAPVVEVDGVIHSHMTQDKLRRIIQSVGGRKRS